MEVKTIDDCLRFRLLRRVVPDREKCGKSIELSESAVSEAEDSLNSPFLKYTVSSSYMAMFHISRALLYLDGIQEKSHFAIYIYLKEKYSDKISPAILNLLNIHRKERHEVNYGFGFKPSIEDAEQALKDAKLFVSEIKKLIEKRQKQSN